MKFLNKISLQWRVLALTIGAATLVVLLIEGISNWRTAAALENEVGGQTNNAAKQLADKLKRHSLDEIPDVFRSLLPPIRKLAPNILRVDVYAEKSGKLALVNSTMMNQRVLEDFETEALKSGKARTYMLEPEPGRRRIVTVRPIRFRDGHQGFVTLICSLKPFKQLLAIHSRVRNYALAATILFLVVTITWMFQSGIYRNIRHLIAVISRFRQGEERARTEERLPGEFGDLAKHLNSLLQEISQFQAKLREEVEQATQSLSARNQELNAMNVRLAQMQRKLSRAERLAVIGQLTATFAHEIGSPLSAVSMHLQMLEEEGLPDKTVQSIRTSYVQLNRVCGIVERLLLNARQPQKRQTVDLVAPLQAACDLVSPVARIRNVDIQLQADAGPLLTSADPDQLQQLFINLFNNALDAIAGPGFIHIRAARLLPPGSGIRIEVSDTGGGIPRDKIGEIFTPLFTTKDIGKGTGLGLAVCREIVNQHHGTIEVRSEPGSTTFTVCLPEAASGEKVAAKETARGKK